MKGKAAWLGVAVMTAVIGIALVGCATGPSSSRAGQSQADLLTAAGFRLHTADTPKVWPIFKPCRPRRWCLISIKARPVFSLHRP